MASYIIRRLLGLIPIILGVALIFFMVFNVSGGMEKYLYSILPEKGRTPQLIAEYRNRYHLDDHPVLQYATMVKEMITFDFGVSKSQNNRPIIDLIARGVPNSVMISFPGFLFEMIISLFLAFLCAYYRGSWIDRTFTVLTVLGISIPGLVIIIMGQKFLAYDLKLFPIAGWSMNFFAQLKFLVLPWIMWVITAVGYDIRFFRTTFLEEISKDYVRTARAKGLSEPKIMFRHVLKNGMIPVLTYTVISIPGLLTGALMLEQFFTIPGIGYLMIESITKWDLPVLKASVMIFTIFFVLFSLLTDVLYALVDPRVRLD